MARQATWSLRRTRWLSSFANVLGLLSFPRVPLVLFANGALSVNPGSIAFQSQPRPKLLRVLGNIEKHLKLDVTFRLEAAQVIAVERYEMPKPFMKYYSMPWTRVRSSLDGMLGDFLMTVGGSGPLMGGIRDSNARFLSSVQAALRGAA